MSVLDNPILLLKWNSLPELRRGGVFYFDTFLSPGVILMSVGVFGWLMGAGWLKRWLDNRVVRRVVGELAASAYGVYLVHTMVIDWVEIKWRYAIEFMSMGGLFDYVVVRSLLVLGLSFGVAMVLRRIPKVKRLVGEVS